LRLFFDANVVFSAAYQDEGRAQAIAALARAGRCTLLASAHAVEEARRNLALKSTGYEARLERLLAAVSIVPEAPAALVAWAGEQGLPPKDAPILAAAAHAQADLLVTGDSRDFGHLFGVTLRGVKVATPAQALAALLRDLAP
jgi:predicted nucleic acid-binding protein